MSIVSRFKDAAAARRDALALQDKAIADLPKFKKLNELTARKVGIQHSAVYVAACAAPPTDQVSASAKADYEGIMTGCSREFDAIQKELLQEELAANPKLSCADMMQALQTKQRFYEDLADQSPARTGMRAYLGKLIFG